MLAPNILYYGQPEPLPERIPLRAGPLALFFEQNSLRYLRVGAHEVVRRIYAAVRDQNWGTAPDVLSNLHLDVRPDSFHIDFDVTNQIVATGVDFTWHGEISGDASGCVQFSMDGVARSSFLRNRIGFCVLHPMAECASHVCVVQHADGRMQEGIFPRYIAPQQPFQDMRAISYEVAPGLHAEVRFEGDVFEMEDQRNWTDASFKTYCTPLGLPYPVAVTPGTRVQQGVTLTVTGEPATQAFISAPAPARATPVEVTLNEASSLPLPSIGLALHGDDQPALTAREIERLRTLHLGHLYVDLDFTAGEDAVKRRWQEASALARQLGVPLQVALLVSDKAVDAWLRFVRDVLPALQHDVCEWLVLGKTAKVTPAHWVQRVRESLAQAGNTAPVGGGTNAYFTELNRNRPAPALLDRVCYSINPQVHAFDLSSLVETLAAQQATVESARQFCDATPVSVGPVTLKMRFNPDAFGSIPPVPPGELPPQVDVRQMSLFGAGWTLGSLKYLTTGGAARVTYYETHGWRGVMETEQGSLLPDKFHSLPGAVFPPYHMLAAVGDFAGGAMLGCTSSEPLSVDALALRRGEYTRLLLANFTAKMQMVRVRAATPHARLHALDVYNAVEVMQSPESFRAKPGDMQATHAGVLSLQLPPFGLAWLDW
jgi:hypothetical protein